MTEMEATVRVPATSANLGSGFDCLGLALDLHDEAAASLDVDRTSVRVRGEGAGVLPTDHNHLVVRSLHAAFAHCGRRPPAVRLECRNAIPQSRGLGSSAAAVAAGIRLAQQFLGPDGLDDAEALRLAARLEGHPDNVAACLLGGLTAAWNDAAGARAVSMTPHPGLRPAVYVPRGELATATARAALPERVALEDAVFNLARSALAVHAFVSAPRFLWEATADRLHQAARAEAMPESAALVGRLRDSGTPAAISGAGPSVIAFTDEPPEATGFEVMELRAASGAALP